MTFARMLAALLFCAVTATAQIPSTVSFQGVISDVMGEARLNGPHSFHVRIFDSVAGGVELFAETTVANVSDGVFDIIIGEVSGGIPTAIPFDRQYYVGISVDGGEELSPRTPLTSVPYAFRSRHADSAATADHAATADVAASARVAAIADELSKDARVVRRINGADGVLTLEGAGATSITRNASTITITSKDSNLVLPFVRSQADTGALFGLTNTGIGRAATFATTNTSTTQGISTALGINGGIAQANGSVLFLGTYLGAIDGRTPMAGRGSRLMWIPFKSAFRAGNATSSQWDDSLIGDFSAAFGLNSIARRNFTFAAGNGSIATGVNATAMGSATASGSDAFAVGVTSLASGDQSIALGSRNTASGFQSTCLGTSSTASGQNAIAMGIRVIASGVQSTAIGSDVSTNLFTGSFVYGDASAFTATSATASNQFMVRASGGTIFYSTSTLTAGVTLAPGGGAWASVSDRKRKENVRAEDGEVVLTKLRGVPVTSWNYTSQPATIRHIGPMAQDLFAEFGMGESDTTITSIDIDGINLIAVQALEKRTTELKARVAELEMLRAQNAELTRRIEALETVMMSKVASQQTLVSQPVGSR